MSQPPVVHLRTGIAAVTAGALMFASVAAELVWEVQRWDGSFTSTVGFALFVIGFAIGTAALVAAVHGMRGLVCSRTGRVGRRITLTGAGLLTAFAVLFLGSGLVAGRPMDAAFWLFLLGFLLIIVGAVPLGLGLRRCAAVGPWWTAVPVAGAGALVAVFTQSPLHEVGLFTFDAAWAALGLRLLATPRPAPSARDAVPTP